VRMIKRKIPGDSYKMTLPFEPGTVWYLADEIPLDEHVIEKGATVLVLRKERNVVDTLIEGRILRWDVWSLSDAVRIV
jgi:hypothetical protein